MLHSAVIFNSHSRKLHHKLIFVRMSQGIAGAALNDVSYSLGKLVKSTGRLFGRRQQMHGPVQLVVVDTLVGVGMVVVRIPCCRTYTQQKIRYVLMLMMTANELFPRSIHILASDFLAIVRE